MTLPEDPGQRRGRGGQPSDREPAFLADVGGELRSLLRRALELLEELLAGRRAPLPEGVVTSLAEVDRDCREVQRLVDALLDFCRVEADREQALRASEAELRATFELGAGGQAQGDPVTGDLLRVNRSLCRLVGYSEAELLAMTFLDLTHPDDVDRDFALFQQLVRGEVPEYTIEKRLLRKDGSLLWAQVTATVIRDAEGRPLRSLAVGVDVTERKQAEEALTLFRALIDRAGDAIEVVDPETGRFLDVNEKACLVHGYTREEYLSLTVADVNPAGSARPWSEFAEELRQAGFVSVEGQHRRKDGSLFPVEVHVNYIRLSRDYIVAVVRDISDRRRLEEQLRQAQKMEAVGRLAGGVAHDFNNLLTVINGYSELLFDSLPPGDPGRALVGEIRGSGQRATDLTRQLLAFSRRQVLQPQVVSLHARLAELSRLLRRLIGEDVELDVVSDPALGLVKIDPGQFEQAIINLVVNARDAMPLGGRLTLEARDVELGTDYAAQHSEVGPGLYVRVAVSDTGEGMDEATRAHIFEPFFTTKEPGKGTGLGLAMVYGFIKQSNGHVEVYSEAGHGTTFKIYLPRAGETTPTAQPTPDLPAAPEGTETVLLVEDEEALRALARRVLQAAGYRVLEAGNGEEAVRVAREHTGPIDLLVTDLVMPRMGGRQLADALVEARPALHVLFTSGYTGEAIPRNGELGLGLAFLQKPFTPTGLARKVREVLDGPAPPAAGTR